MTIAKVKIKLYVKKVTYRTVAVFIFFMATGGWANALNGPEGEWDWDKDNSSSVFSIRLASHGNGLLGSYCAVALSGRRIDCAPSDDAKKYPVWLDGREFEFWTNYSDQSGIATLTQVGDKLHWVIIKHPDGECFAPTDAWLSKRQLQDKNQ